MKKLLSILLTFILTISCVSFTALADYNSATHAEEFAKYDAADYDPFAGKDTVVVSIIGGSLTCGDGTKLSTVLGQDPG